MINGYRGDHQSTADGYADPFFSLNEAYKAAYLHRRPFMMSERNIEKREIHIVGSNERKSFSQTCTDYLACVWGTRLFRCDSCASRYKQQHFFLLFLVCCQQRGCGVGSREHVYSRRTPIEVGETYSRLPSSTPVYDERKEH